MIFIGAGSLLLNIFISRRNIERFKIEAMNKKADKVDVKEGLESIAGIIDKKADKSFVDREAKRITKETDLKILAVRESNEELKTLLEDIGGKVNYIYEKHWKE